MNTSLPSGVVRDPVAEDPPPNGESVEERELVDAVLSASRALVAVAARSLAACGTEITLPQYRVLAPNGDLVLAAGDSVTLVTRSGDLGQVRDHFEAPPDQGRVEEASLPTGEPAAGA